MSQLTVGITAAGQFLVGIAIASQPLRRMTATVRLMDLVVIVWSIIGS